MKRDDDALRESMLRYLEGAAPERDVRRLSEAVRNDPAARREMAELLLQDVLLARIARETELLDVVTLDTEPDSGKPPALSTTRLLRIRREYVPRRRSWAIPLSAAAVLLVAAGVIAIAATRGRDPQAGLARRPSAPVPAEEARRPAPPSHDEQAALPEPPRPPEPPPAAAVRPPEPKRDPRPAAPASPEPFQGLVRSEKAPALPLPPPPADNAGGKPAVRAWEVVIAKIDRVQGDVSVLSGPVRTAAKAGQNLTWGQGLETGSRSAVTVRYPDSTRLELSPGAVVWEASDRPGPRGEEGPKRFHVTAGTVAADVARQPAGRPMTLVTPHGEAKILGTRFKLLVEPESTRLEMKEGKVQVTRKEDQASVDVGAGFYVVVAKGVALEPKPLPPPVETAPKGSRPK